MKVEMPEMVATGMREFTGRGWVLPKLLEWLEHTEKRTFIITGKPGTGKSSLVAWFSGTETTTEADEANLELKRVRSFVKAVHFCMANTLNAVPKALAQSLAEQLTSNVAGVVSILSHLDDLPAQVRFLMTTRPDRRVLIQFSSAQVVDLTSDSPTDADEVRAYAYERLALPDDARRTRLADIVSNEANGNFLYARLVIDNLLPRLDDLTDLTTINFPKGSAESIRIL